MKKEDFNNQTNQLINNVDENSKMMDNIEDQKNISSAHLLRRGLILVAILISCSMVVFAGVKTVQLIELKNDEDEVIGSVEVVETEENPHLDSHISMEELFRYGDSLSNNRIWDSKSFAVIDTTIDFPYNVDIRPLSKHLRSYIELSDLDKSYVLPLNIGDYTFNIASLHYTAKFLEEDEVEKLIEENDGERFIVQEIETGEMRSITYNYKNSESDLSMSINIEFFEEGNTSSVYSSMSENYEVIQVNDIDVFLVENKYLGVTYQENKTVKLIGENHYESTWYEPDHKIKVNITPNLMNWGAGIEKEIDGEICEVRVYPENTKEEVILMTKLLHEFFNETKD